MISYSVLLEPHVFQVKLLILRSQIDLYHTCSVSKKVKSDGTSTPNTASNCDSTTKIGNNKYIVPLKIFKEKRKIH